MARGATLREEAEAPQRPVGVRVLHRGGAEAPQGRPLGRGREMGQIQSGPRRVSRLWPEGGAQGPGRFQRRPAAEAAVSTGTGTSQPQNRWSDSSCSKPLTRALRSQHPDRTGAAAGGVPGTVAARDRMRMKGHLAGQFQGRRRPQGTMRGSLLPKPLQMMEGSQPPKPQRRRTTPRGLRQKMRTRSLQPLKLHQASHRQWNPASRGIRANQVTAGAKPK